MLGEPQAWPGLQPHLLESLVLCWGFSRPGKLDDIHAEVTGTGGGNSERRASFLFSNTH